MSYVDGFLIPVPKKNAAKYKKLATMAGKVWMEYGAIAYCECIGDDVKPGKLTSFPQGVKLKKGEQVWFSWIVYRSRKDRDRINAKVMKVFTTDPKWKNDSAMRLYRTVMKRYAPSANVDDVYHVYGMAAAWTAVEALRKAGKNLTREALVKVTNNMNFTGNPFLLPGIGLKTGPGDHFPIEQMVLQRWHKGTWKSFGGIWGYRTA